MPREVDALLFLSAVATLFGDSTPFFLAPPYITPRTLSRNNRSNILKRAPVAASGDTGLFTTRRSIPTVLMVKDDEAEAEGTVLGGFQDVCTNEDGKTPLWHRLAFKNSARIKPGDVLPDVLVR